MKVNCLIIDDEPLAISILESHAKNLDYLHIVDTFTDAVKALPILQKDTIDLIYLDINMSRINGLEFLRSLKKPPLVVLTTAYREYALESYELDVVDYLVKPISFTRFLKSANKVVDRLNVANGNAPQSLVQPYIFVKVDKKMVKVVLNEILFIESLKDYIKIYTAESHLIVHKALASIVEELPSENFIRVHKSFAIAIDKVKAIEGSSLEIASNTIPIGRSYLKKAKETIFSGAALASKNVGRQKT